MTDLAHPVLFHYCTNLSQRHRLIIKSDGSVFYFDVLSCDREVRMCLCRNIEFQGSDNKRM
jgi:hypothetical protein